jgi:hypothetical protein
MSPEFWLCPTVNHRSSARIARPATQVYPEMRPAGVTGYGLAGRKSNNARHLTMTGIVSA